MKLKWSTIKQILQIIATIITTVAGTLCVQHLPSSISHLTSFSFFPNLCQLPWSAVKLAKALIDQSPLIHGYFFNIIAGLTHSRACSRSAKLMQASLCSLSIAGFFRFDSMITMQ